MFDRVFGHVRAFLQLVFVPIHVDLCVCLYTFLCMTDCLFVRVVSLFVVFTCEFCVCARVCMNY